MGIGWNFDNSYARLPNAFYAEIELNPVRAPKLVKLNESLAQELGLDVEALQSEKAIAIFAGNTAPAGSKPIAQAYAGHQFGHFTMLGDGRAVLLGEQITPKDERFDLQLKGSGRTPFSRGGDGRAALGPMLREYIISEAMHALGIPTTRCLAVVTTGETIIRETELPGAVLTRVASSHLRVGTFQYAANMGSYENLEVLAHYAIIRHYEFIPNSETRYLRLLEEVIKRQADLIAKWQLVGFIHGVMNTDNMTISGETIDYGPCAFMDTYDPKTVFSSIDRHGRYAYENQPVIGGWNLARFAESLIPLIHEDPEQGIELAQNEISKYMALYEESYQEGMSSKLGLFNKEDQDKELINELLNLMHKHRADYTNTFRGLTIGDMTDSPMVNKEDFQHWYDKWQARLSRQEQSKDEVIQLMQSWNPVVIPRNHRVEEALEAAVNGDYSVMEKLLKVLSNPYDYTSELAKEYCSLPAPSNLPYRTFCGT